MGSKVHKLKGSLMVLAWGAVAAFGVFYLTDNLSSAIIVMGIACFILFVVHKKWDRSLSLADVESEHCGNPAVLGKVLETMIISLRRIIDGWNPEKYASSLRFRLCRECTRLVPELLKRISNSAQKRLYLKCKMTSSYGYFEELGVFGALWIVCFGLLLYRLCLLHKIPILWSLIVTEFFPIAIQVIWMAVVVNLILIREFTAVYIMWYVCTISYDEMGIALEYPNKIER